MAALANNERELLFAYLPKVGPKVDGAIRKDGRIWHSPDGTEPSRRAGMWGESRKVLFELEAIASSGRALIPSYQMRGKGGGGKPGAGGGGG